MNASKQTPNKRVRINQSKPQVDETTVPKQNILDLRSIIARKEVSTRQTAAQHKPSTKTKPAKQQASKRPLHQRLLTRQPKAPRLATPAKATPVKAAKVKKPKPPRQKKSPQQPLTSKQVAALPAFGFSLRTVLAPLAVFIAIGLVIVLVPNVSRALQPLDHIQTQVVSDSQAAIADLQTAASNLQANDFRTASQSFQSAADHFSAAQDQVATINRALLTVAPLVPGKGQQLSSGRKLLSAGNNLAEAGQSIATALELLSSTDLAAAANDPDVGVTQTLVVLRAALEPASQQIHAASQDLADVSATAIPEEQRALFIQAQTALPSVDAIMSDSINEIDLLLAILGHDDPKRYLLVFQNPYEQRPSGGFIGSLALIDIDKGVLKQFNAPGGGVYDVSGQFDQKLISPSPLHLVNAHWNLQDANWFPHVPASSQKIQWFYENSNQPSVDGVIYITPKVVEDMLAIVGSVQLGDEFDQIEITPDNFYRTVQTIAEQKFDENPQSKKIIGALLPELTKKLLDTGSDPEQMLQVLQLFQDDLARKDIMITVNDSALQAQLDDRDWTGSLATTERDYLHVNVANIGGHKASGAAEKIVHHTATVNPDGAIDVTVTVTSVHKGDSADALENVNIPEFIRFYVPQGSRLTAASGFEEPDATLFFTPDRDATVDADYQAYSGDITIDDATGIYHNNEFDHTVFGGWAVTRLGESSQVSVTYRLPFALHWNSWLHRADHYSLLVQKQPGSFDDVFIHELRLPDGAHIIQASPSDYDGALQQILDRDLFVGAVIQQ